MQIDALILLIALTALNDRRIDFNVYDIVTLQDVTDGELVGEGAHCAVATLDGRSLYVRETCQHIRHMIDMRIDTK